MTLCLALEAGPLHIDVTASEDNPGSEFVKVNEAGGC